jgi:hypothetical protein
MKIDMAEEAARLRCRIIAADATEVGQERADDGTVTYTTHGRRFVEQEALVRTSRTLTYVYSLEEE